jgi:hypothetical protein
MASWPFLRLRSKSISQSRITRTWWQRYGQLGGRAATSHCFCFHAKEGVLAGRAANYDRDSLQ